MKHNNRWARSIAKDLLEQGWSAEEAKTLLIILVKQFIELLILWRY